MISSDDDSSTESVAPMSSIDQQVAQQVAPAGVSTEQVVAQQVEAFAQHQAPPPAAAAPPPVLQGEDAVDLSAMPTTDEEEDCDILGDLLWQTCDVTHLGLGPMPINLIGSAKGGAIFCADADKVVPKTIKERIIAAEPERFVVADNAFYDVYRRQDPIKPMKKWTVRSANYPDAVRQLEQFLQSMSGLHHYRLYNPVIISNTLGVLEQQVYVALVYVVLKNVLYCCHLIPSTPAPVRTTRTFLTKRLPGTSRMGESLLPSAGQTRSACIS